MLQYSIYSSSRYTVRSSHPEVFCKKCILKNFPKLTGKHLCQSLFFNKVAGLRPKALLKKRLWHRCFLVNFAKFLRTSFLIEHLHWLLVYCLHYVLYRKTVKPPPPPIPQFLSPLPELIPIPPLISPLFITPPS